MVDKERTDVRQNEWENASVLWGRWHITTVHENVLASTVTMEVCENEQFSLFREVMYHLLGVVDGRMQDFRWRLPSSIQITTCQ